MPQATPSIFNKKATEKLRNPDDLDKYVRVTNPTVWIVLFACIALVAGLLAWGVFGAVSTSVSTTGTVVDGQAMCFLSTDDVAKVRKGDAAYVDGNQMEVREVAELPLSPDELRYLLKSDYLVHSLAKNDWAYPVYFGGDLGDTRENVPISVSITTERISPIELLLGKRG